VIRHICLALVTDTRSTNRALRVSVTHGRDNLRRLPKDKLDRQREGSMEGLLFAIPSFETADKVIFLCGLQVWLQNARRDAGFCSDACRHSLIVSVVFCGWDGGGQISGVMRVRTGGPASYAKFPAANPKSPPWDNVRYTSVFGRKADIAF